MALSADGNTALIGGPSDSGDVGAAWVFTRSGSTWTQQGPKLTGERRDRRAVFGSSVALSSDGNTALIVGPDTPISEAADSRPGRRGCSRARARPGRSRAPKLTGRRRDRSAA